MEQHPLSNRQCILSLADLLVTSSLPPSLFHPPRPDSILAFPGKQFGLRSCYLAHNLRPALLVASVMLLRRMLIFGAWCCCFFCPVVKGPWQVSWEVPFPPLPLETSALYWVSGEKIPQCVYREPRGLLLPQDKFLSGILL